MLSVSNLVPASLSTDFVRSEILRVGAPLTELQSAIALLDEGAILHPRVYDALSPRMRRLVDLIGVGGSALALSICEASAANPAEA